MELATRLRIMLPVFDTPLRGSAGTGRRARFRIWCREAWGFESPLPHHLASLCDESIKTPLLLEYQPGQAWPAGTLLLSSCLKKYAFILRTAWPPQSLYIVPTALRRPILVMVLLAMSGRVAAGGASKPSLGLAPPPLPEYRTEVVP